jgi:hypothetical protein
MLIFIPSDHPIPFGHGKVKSFYADWGELAVKLEDDNFKAEYVSSFHSFITITM